MIDKERAVGLEKNHGPDSGPSTRRARWGRRGVIVSLLIGLGTLAAKSFSWLHFSPADDGEYQVMTEWKVPAGGEGLIIAVSPLYGREELRALGGRLQERFRRLDSTAVTIFDDANAARQVREGSRTVGEKQFQAALVHQRAMYLKSAPRGGDSFTIYKSYPVVDEVIRFDEDDLQKKIR